MAQNKTRYVVKVPLAQLLRSVASSSAIETGEKVETIEKRLLAKRVKQA